MKCCFTQRPQALSEAQLRGNHAAMVFDAAAGSPAVLPSGLTVETFRFQLAPILDKAVGFSPQKPRHLLGSHTKTLRPIVLQTASEAPPVLCLKAVSYTHLTLPTKA